MNEPPLVSILTPTFNHRPFIERCLASVRAQTQARWEQIVLDDGSTDGTPECVEEVRDERVRLVRRAHVGIAGLGEAYNRGLAMAAGEFVAVLEGDDFWPADKLEQQLPVFENSAVVMSWGRAAETDPEGRVRRLIPDRRTLLRLDGASPGTALRVLLEGNPIPSCTVVCRRSALLAVGGFRQPPGIPTVDLPTWAELCRVGSIAPLDRLLGYYRRHPGQVSAQMKRQMLGTVGWATDFVRALPERERSALGLTVADARRIERQTWAAVQLLAARRAAALGQRPQAVARLRAAVRTGSGGTRLKALAALALALSPLGLGPAEAGLAGVRRSGVRQQRGRPRR